MDGGSVGEELYRRLKQLKKARAGATGRDTTPAAGAATPETVATNSSSRDAMNATPKTGEDGRWTEVAPLVWERVIRWPQIELPRTTFFSRLLNSTVDSSTLRFMDTETTGLSGGAGTTVFLSGCAQLESETLTFRQTLLADFPGERDFVERIIAQLGRDTTWVSYNGKAFDARQLQTRCLLNGIRPAFPFHIDLLYWARRLWNRMLPSCSLTTIETHVLDEPRIDDVPSIEVPERYFSFLDSGDWSLLDPVFEHHLHDVRSLARLFLLLEEVLKELRSVEFDAYQLGRWMLANHVPSGIDLLEEVLRGGGVVESDRERAGFYLLRHYRRLRRRGDAARIAGQCPRPSEWLLVEELAKFYEHDQRDPRAALELLEAYCTRCPTICGGERVERRQRRLKRKVDASPRD
jgi:hypothetical protein